MALSDVWTPSFFEKLKKNGICRGYTLINSSVNQNRERSCLAEDLKMSRLKNSSWRVHWRTRGDTSIRMLPQCEYSVSVTTLWVLPPCKSVTTLWVLQLLLQSCYICEEQGRESRASSGACMQCNKAGCKMHFHVTWYVWHNSSLFFCQASIFLSSFFPSTLSFCFSRFSWKFCWDI